MSIWYKEIVKVHGELKAYVEVQNEWSGAIRGGLREIHHSNEGYWCTTDGKRVMLTHERQDFLDKEDYVKRATEYYKKAGGF